MKSSKDYYPEFQQAWTLESLIAEQSKDESTKHIVRYLKDPSEVNKQRLCPNVHNLQNYFLDNSGALFIKIRDDKAELRQDEEVIVVPKELQQTAIKLIHNTVLGGHSGVERTLFSLKRRFYWRSMARDVKSYVNMCVTDFVTRYCVVRPLVDKRATTVAEGLWSIFCEHGTPSTLYSDQGSEFRNKILKEMAKNFQFSHKFFTVYHPASNGLCERKNSSILTAIKCF